METISCAEMMSIAVTCNVFLVLSENKTNYRDDMFWAVAAAAASE